MSSKPIEIIENFVAAYLNIKLPKLNEESNYIQLLNIIKKVNIENKCEIRLLILIFEEIFLKQNEFITNNNNKEIQYLDLFTKIIIPKDIGNNSDYKVIKKCFSNLPSINDSEIYLIYKLMCLRKSSTLFLEALQIIFLIKDKYYVRNKNLIIEDKDKDRNYYYNILYLLINLLNNEFNDGQSQLYTFDLKELKLKKREANNEEIEEYYNREKELKLKDIINFINKVKYVENKNSSNISNKILNDNLNNNNNNMESQNIIQKEKTNIEEEFKLINSRLEHEIAELKISLQNAINNIKRNEEKVNGLNNTINGLHSPINGLHSNINGLHSIINGLKKEISDIKAKNNSLIITNEKILKDNQIMKSEIAINGMKNKKDIDGLNNKLKISEKDKEKYKSEIGLVKSRDSEKFIIDFLYTILNKEIDLSLTYENKVKNVCEKIKNESSPEQSSFVSNLCEFLNHLFQGKVKGDSTAHPIYFVDGILNENINVSNFFTYFLEVKKYFYDFKALYFSNNEKEKEVKVKIIQQNCNQINLFTCLNEFSRKNKLIFK